MKYALLLSVGLAFPGTAGANELEHPAVVFLDATGAKVLDTGAPVSTMVSCGACHETDFIESHSYHVSLGSDAERAARFDVVTYDFGDPAAFDADELDAWLRRFAGRHVGGGFATGTEMNCFLCHTENPAAEARLDALAQGDFAWAPTATLSSTELVQREGQTWKWNAKAFDEAGAPLPKKLGLGVPSNANCGQCHGATVADHDEPFFLAPSALRPSTETTGVIISAGRIRRSGMNLAGKDDLSRPWDVHAERLLDCTDCHASLNDPSFYAEAASTRPGHLKVEARRLEIGEFLRTPSHDFAKGDVSQAQAGGDVAGTMMRCEDCHDGQAVHDWLPYTRRHLDSMQCEACHIPKVYGAARESTDWTLLTEDGDALVTYRGVRGDPSDPSELLSGYTPVLLPRDIEGGGVRLAPQNLTSVFYWWDNATMQRVSLATLQGALLSNGAYRPELVSLLDADGDGELTAEELRLTRPEAISAVRESLIEAGAGQPEIRGELKSYGVHHGVAPGSWATRDCGVCHGENSRFGAKVSLARYLPGGVIPAELTGTNVHLAGSVEMTPEGGLVYSAKPGEVGLNLLGFESGRLVDRLGRWAIVLTLLGVLIHGGTRVFLSFQNKSKEVAA